MTLALNERLLGAPDALRVARLQAVPRLGQVGAPFQEQLENVEGPDHQRLVEQGVRFLTFKVKPVAVAEEQENEVAVLPADGDVCFGLTSRNDASVTPAASL